MLTLTEKALEIVRKIPNDPRYTLDAGLRIARRPGAEKAPFHVAPAERPRAGDRVVDVGGGRVFLGPNAQRELAGTTLDARADDRGRVEFLVKA